MAEEAKNKEQELETKPVVPEEGEVKEKTVEELKAENAQLELDKIGMEEQIVEQRTKKQEAEALLLGKVEVKEPAKEEEDPEKKEDAASIVNSILNKKEKETKDKNRISALKKFWTENPEFNPANDVSGVRMGLVNSAMERLNTSKSVSVEEILEDYSDSLKLIRDSKDKRTRDILLDTSIGGKTKSEVKVEDTRLTPEQEKLRLEKGWTVERYLEMKAKYPRVVT